MNAHADSAAVLAPPPLIYVAGLAGGYGAQSLLPKTPLPAVVALPVGGALMLAGAALARSFVRGLHRSATTVSPYRPSTALVTTGPYRFSRNPGYLGMTIACAGLAIATQSLWVLPALAVSAAVVQRGVIAREEAYLERVFGEEYLAYQHRVRRWL